MYYHMNKFVDYSSLLRTAGFLQIQCLSATVSSHGVGVAALARRPWRDVNVAVVNSPAGHKSDTGVIVEVLNRRCDYVAHVE